MSDAPDATPSEDAAQTAGTPEAAEPTAAPVSMTPAVPVERTDITAPHVSVKTNAAFHYKQVDADGKVTTFDADPNAAKRMFIGAGILIVLSLIVGAAATIMLVSRIFS